MELPFDRVHNKDWNVRLERIGFNWREYEECSDDAACKTGSIPWVYEKARWDDETANDWLLSIRWRGRWTILLWHGFANRATWIAFKYEPNNELDNILYEPLSESYNLCLRWCWPTDVARKFNEKFYSHQKSRPRFKENMNIALLLESVPWRAKTCGCVE
jgi:hypothetical protein